MVQRREPHRIRRRRRHSTISVQVIALGLAGATLPSLVGFATLRGAMLEERSPWAEVGNDPRGAGDPSQGQAPGGRRSTQADTERHSSAGDQPRPWVDDPDSDDFWDSSAPEAGERSADGGPGHWSTRAGSLGFRGGLSHGPNGERRAASWDDLDQSSSDYRESTVESARSSKTNPSRDSEYWNRERAKRWYRNRRYDQRLGTKREYGGHTFTIGARVRIANFAGVRKDGTTVYVNVGQPGSHKPAVLLPLDRPQDTDFSKFERGDPLKVWVKEFPFQLHLPPMLTMYPPKRSVESLEIGEKLKGKVVDYANFSGKLGGCFVDVGADWNGLLLEFDMLGEGFVKAQDVLNIGQEIVVWVSDKSQTRDRFKVTMIQPEIKLTELEIGNEYTGKIEKIPKKETGGVFVNIGAVKLGWLPPDETEKLTIPATVGQVLNVFVKNVREEQDFSLTLEKPKLSVLRLIPGQKLVGNVTALPAFGGVFVDVGAVRDGLVHKRLIPEELSQHGRKPLRVGDAVTTWVKEVKDARNFQLTFEKPRLQVCQLKIGDMIHGNISGFAREGGVFVEVGLVSDALVGSADVSFYRDVARHDEAHSQGDLELGKEVKLWVRYIRRDTSNVHCVLVPPTTQDAEDEIVSPKPPSDVTSYAARGVV